MLIFSSAQVSAAASWVYALATCAIFWVAWYTLTRSARLERARWAVQLYNEFFVKSTHENYRKALDHTHHAHCEIAKAVAEEPEDFTNFLNFFELIAYLQESGQLEVEDVKAIFHYYLCRFKDHEELTAYVANKKNGYDYLDKLLKTKDYC